MGFIIIIPFAALAGWCIFAIVRWLRRGGYWLEWRTRFAILSVTGLAVGIGCASFTQYRVGNMLMEGFPFPAGISSREKPEALWVKSDMPTSIRAGSMVIDLLFGVAVCLAPIALALFFKENRGKGIFKNPNSP